MPSMGVLGAIKGGTSAFGSYLNDELAQQRAIALEELRTTNNRETNRINNEQRFKNAQTLQDLADKSPTANKRDYQLLIDAGVSPEDAMARVFPGRAATSPRSNQGVEPWMVDLADEQGNPVIGADGNPRQKQIGYRYLDPQGVPQQVRFNAQGQPGPGMDTPIPPDAIKFLEDNPGLWPRFQEWYGEEAAEQYRPEQFKEGAGTPGTDRPVEPSPAPPQAQAPVDSQQVMGGPQETAQAAPPPQAAPQAAPQQTAAPPQAAAPSYQEAMMRQAQPAQEAMISLTEMAKGAFGDQMKDFSEVEDTQMNRAQPGDLARVQEMLARNGGDLSRLPERLLRVYMKSLPRNSEQYAQIEQMLEKRNA